MGLSCVGPELDFSGPSGPLPTQNSLWFYDSVHISSDWDNMSMYTNLMPIFSLMCSFLFVSCFLPLFQGTCSVKLGSSLHSGLQPDRE